MRNVHAAARQDDAKREIVFLRRIVPGGASKSYGIDVARLAGLPPAVIERARLVMGELEAGTVARRVAPSAQLPLLPTAPSPVVARLAAVEVDRTTPLEALQLLAELKTLV